MSGGLGWVWLRSMRGREFYRKRFGFQALADDPNHLYLLVKTAKKALS